jgi:hypothetical protein|nr:MAG TPA: Portal protein [Bacteriophage sp.]
MAKDEIGRAGQQRYGGVFYEEFLPGLRGQRGIRAYKEMSENDDIIGAILFAVKMLIRNVHWDVQPGGAEKIDEECAEFVESCLYDMEDSWTGTLSEILSFLVYGWSAHEIVYKRRMGRNRNAQLNSKHADGLVGWRKLPIRAQDTLYQWEYGGRDDLTGMTQMPPPDFGLITIPIEKLLLFRTESRKGNPEGRSILRNAYRSWFFKKRFQEIEGIGIERDLAGLPVLVAPAGVNIWDDDPDIVHTRTLAEALVKNIRRDSMEGIVLPSGWDLRLLSTGGKRNFDTNATIDRYDTRMAMTVLADFVLLGHQKVGSFALSDNKTEMFSLAIGAFLDIICEEFNKKAIPYLVDVNGVHFGSITDYPELVHGDIETQDLGKIGDYIQKMTGIGVLQPDAGLEDFVRQQAGLPERIDEYQTRPVNDPQPPRGEESTQDIQDITMEENGGTAAARNRLGRG